MKLELLCFIFLLYVTHLPNVLFDFIRSTMIMERVDTDPYPSIKFYMKQQIFDSYQKDCITINCHVCRGLKINDL